MMKNNHLESTKTLLAHHLEHLRGSGISDIVISERGYSSVTEARYLIEAGFDRSQTRVPGILIPIWACDDNRIVSYQFRPDIPRINRNGKPIKYESPKGATNRIDCPPRCRQYLGDPSITLWITEGLKKGDCLASLNQCVIALTGIWNWKSKNERGGVTFSSDFDYIALNGRKVYLAPDSDFSTNNSVKKAVLRLAEHLKRKGAEVSVIVIPSSTYGEKIGLDDFIVGGHSLAELERLAMPISEVESEEESEKQLYRNYFYYKDRLYLEIRRYDGGYGFACLNEKGQVEVNNQVVAGKEIIKPRPLPESEGKPVPIVSMPDENIINTPFLSAGGLYQKLNAHISTYVDLPNLDLELCIFYILFTWFYKKERTLGYLRFLADTGKGKSRSQKVVGDVCFYPVFASGVSSFSGIARLNNRWRGTLVIDEADIDGDKEHQFVKYLNLGFERDKYYVLSDKQNPRRQEFFDPYAPKILAMRQPFKDNATEARLLSISPHETMNPEIPILLPPEYYSQAQQLRNELALFTLQHWNEVDGTKMMSFVDIDIEPRLKQLAMPLSVIFQLWPDGSDLFKKYLIRRQQEIKKIRALSWEGSLFNLVYSIAVGDLELKEQFGEYYDPETKQIQAVTPTMVSKQISSTTKTVTQCLNGIGLEVERKLIKFYRNDFNNGDKEKKRVVRAYVVLDQKTWDEIVSRYYYQEDDARKVVLIPDILKSKKFVSENLSNASKASKAIVSSDSVDGFDTFDTSIHEKLGGNQRPSRQQTKG